MDGWTDFGWLIEWVLTSLGDDVVDDTDVDDDDFHALYSVLLASNAILQQQQQ